MAIETERDEGAGGRKLGCRQHVARMNCIIKKKKSRRRILIARIPRKDRGGMSWERDCPQAGVRDSEGRGQV